MRKLLLLVVVGAFALASFPGDADARPGARSSAARYAPQIHGGGARLRFNRALINRLRGVGRGDSRWRYR